MKVYKILFIDECDRPWEAFEHTEVVKATELANYVDTMNREGRICEETYDIFKEKHPDGIMTEADALELLEMDGYSVQEYDI